MTEQGLKAPVSSSKKMMVVHKGATKGSAIRMFPATDTIALAEGIETCLAIHQAIKIPIWSTLNANGMKNIQLPDNINRVSIWFDKDISRTGEEAALILAKRLIIEGKKVSIHEPPITIPDGECKGVDWLDVLTEEAEGFDAIVNSYKSCKILNKSELNQKLDNLNLKKQNGNYLLGQLADESLSTYESVKQFDTKILPIPLQNYVESVCSQTDADPIMVTASLLGAISAYLNTRVYMDKPYYFQRLYPNLWMLSISPSGTFKTTALNLGAKIAIDNDEAINNEILTLRSELDTFNVKKYSGNKSIIAKIKSKILELKKQKKLLPDKVTPEALLEVLSNGQKGMILISEIAPWLKNMEKKSNSDPKGQLTHFYDVPNSYNYTTKTKGELIITNPFISIVAVSTMVWLEQSTNDEDFSSGFLARFLLFSPNHQKSVPAALPQIDKFDDTPKNTLKTILENVPNHQEYIITKSAKVCFEGLHNRLYEDLIKMPNHLQEKLGPHVKRWSPYILKIAMIFQFINDSYNKTDYSNKNSKFVKSYQHFFRPISIQSIEAAYMFVQYAITSTVHLYSNELGESEHQKKCSIVLKYIANKGGLVSRQQLISSKILGGGVKEYQYILDTLENQGKIDFKKKKPLQLSEYRLVGNIEDFENI